MVAIILSEMKRILKSSAISQKYPSKSRILRNPKEIKKIQISPKEAHHFSDRKIFILHYFLKEILLAKDINICLKIGWKPYLAGVHLKCFQNVFLFSMEQQNLVFLQFWKGIHIFIYVHVCVKANERWHFNKYTSPLPHSSHSFPWPTCVNTVSKDLHSYDSCISALKDYLCVCVRERERETLSGVF